MLYGRREDSSIVVWCVTAACCNGRRLPATDIDYLIMGIAYTGSPCWFSGTLQQGTTINILRSNFNEDI